MRHARPSLEVEAALARPLGDGAHAAMVEESVPIEDDALDPLLLTAPGDEQADLLGGAHVGRLRELAAEVGRLGRDGEQRLPRLVRDQLGVGVLLASEDAQPRPLVRAAHPTPDARPPTLSPNHLLVRPHQRVPPAAVLPALRRIVSSAYLTPLPL